MSDRRTLPHSQPHVPPTKGVISRQGVDRCAPSCVVRKSILDDSVPVVNLEKQVPVSCRAMCANLISAILWAFICATLSAFGQAQPDSAKHDWIGTWRLISTEEKLRDGRTRPYPDLGEKATGYLMYGADGRMWVALMKLGRANWRHDEANGSKDEKIEAASGFSSYCGRYDVDEAKHVVTHYPEVSFYPNFIGTVQPRPYRLEGNRLTFSDKESSGEVERWTIVWEKVDAGVK